MDFVKEASVSCEDTGPQFDASILFEKMEDDLDESANSGIGQDHEVPTTSIETPSLPHTSEQKEHVPPGSSPTEGLCCYICSKSSSEDDRLKTFNEKTWTSLKNAGKLRARQTSDCYLSVTKAVLSPVSWRTSNFSYHSTCHRKYTAVKRPTTTLPAEQEAKRTKVETRRTSTLPKSDEQGLLKGSCFFCGRNRKKAKGKEDPLLKVSTTAGCESLRSRVEYSSNERVKSLVRSGVDLIAKEAEYHKSCRVQFDKETDMKQQKTECGPRSVHNSAFAELCMYIQDVVIEQQKSVLVSTLLELYKNHYKAHGGSEVDVSLYSMQSLTRKISSKFGPLVTIDLVDQRKGNFVYSSVVSIDDAKARLHENEEKFKEEENIRSAALLLRTHILNIPKSKTPKPTTVQNLKESSPNIPEVVKLFFRTLLCGTTIPEFGDDSKDAIERKVNAMGSDAIYNVTRGTVRPWKHTVLGLGLGSITGSKLAVQMLNREGHSINYSEAKGLETEMAYSATSENRDAPDGIILDPALSTASVWDNNDANIETLDGKNTLHATVGHTYQNVDERIEEPSTSTQFVTGRNRRKYVREERRIAPFRTPLNRAKFTSASSMPEASSSTSVSTVATEDIVESHLPVDDIQPDGVHIHSMKLLDLLWFCKSRSETLPLHAGFMSKFVKDRLPLQRICYMDPISRSPTNNDVVRETMVRSINVAQKTGQDYTVVTYDLAVAMKAYSIQAIEAPLFNNLLIMLGNFHVDLAFFGAVGTFINESGIEYILTEAGILAEGSLMGFIRGKFYSRCTRVHELLANVLERNLYGRFLTTLTTEEKDSFQLEMDMISSDPPLMEENLCTPVITEHLQKYEEYFKSALNGQLGATAQFWTIYIYMINRVYREVQRCVRTNDVDGINVKIFPVTLDIFFALNRPNYARWGCLFLEKLQNANPRIRAMLENGAFSIRRKKKDYARTAVDLSLEQTVNRGAASQVKGIVAFRNSESAIRRWSTAMTQRAMAVTELRAMTGLEVGENVAVQLRGHRIRKDNEHMTGLTATIGESCNPFSADVSSCPLLNVATGKAALSETEKYLLSTLSRGHQDRQKFSEEWKNDPNRFIQRVKRTKVQNFASENVRKKTKFTTVEKAKRNAESLRDVFIRMVIVVSRNTSFDLINILSYPITEYPLSLAHCDGTPVKTCKSTLLRKLESFQADPLSSNDLPSIDVAIHDGGLVLHSVLTMTNVGASYASIARNILSNVCSTSAREVHVCFDTYNAASIKESERRLRGADDAPFVITGSEQCTRQNGHQLLKNGIFKDELAKFVMKEWGQNHCKHIIGSKTLLASHGGYCLQYEVDSATERVMVHQPQHLQGQHEEADTLIAFHANSVTGNVVVRGSDTDVLAILIGAIGRRRPEVRAMSTVVMDCGMGNARRYINVTEIVTNLEECQNGLAAAIPGFHAFTGCDFTSSFYRKGKIQPFDILVKEGGFVEFFVALGESSTSDVDCASKFVCRLYAQSKTADVDEARYIKLIQMAGKINQDNPLANVQRMDCALLPPCRRCLHMKTKRAHYVAQVWRKAVTPRPSEGLSPTDYGWEEHNGFLTPCWFTGPAVPDDVFGGTSQDEQEKQEESDDDILIVRENPDGQISSSEDDAWSEASESDID